MNLQNKKSCNLDQYSWRNRGAKIREKNRLGKREKMLKFSKIRLIYDSKLKSNLRGKTCNLTQNCTQNDTLYC